MFILTRYFSSEKFQSEFMSGSLYSSSLSKFTEIIPERGLEEAATAGDKKAIEILNKKLSEGQRDVMEGAIADLKVESLPMIKEDGLRNVVIGNPKARAVGYSYCNIICFNKVGYTPKYDMQSFKPPMAAPRVISYDVEEPTPMSKDFGAYAAIILDMGEFLKRVKSATTDKGWDVVSGPVNYHPLRLGNKKIVRVNGDRTMTIMMEPAIELDSLIKNGGAVINERDAFDKWDVHDNEREYRICIKRDGKFKDDVRLEIGDISDIAIAVKANEVRQAIDDLLVNRKIQPSIDGYVGTTSREKMRHEFYDMGDGMVNVMLVLGGIAECVEE